MPTGQDEKKRIPSLLGKKSQTHVWAQTAWDDVTRAPFSTLLDASTRKSSKYQVSFDLVQLPAVVPDGVVDAPVAADVLLHRGQVHAPGHHVHLRLPRETEGPYFQLPPRQHPWWPGGCGAYEASTQIQMKL